MKKCKVWNYWGNTDDEIVFFKGIGDDFQFFAIMKNVRAEQPLIGIKGIPFSAA